MGPPAAAPAAAAAFAAAFASAFAFASSSSSSREEPVPSARDRGQRQHGAPARGPEHERPRVSAGFPSSSRGFIFRYSSQRAPPHPSSAAAAALPPASRPRSRGDAEVDPPDGPVSRADEQHARAGGVEGPSCCCRRRKR